MNFLRQRRGGKKIDSLFSLAGPQDARQRWPPSCLMASSAFFLSLPLFLFPLLHLPPSYLFCNKTPLFSKSGSGSGLGLSLVLWRCCKAGTVSSFVVSGLLVSVSCFVRREGPGPGPVASFGSCEEVVKRGCGSRFWGVCCAVPLSSSQGGGMVTGRARPEPELEGNGRGWKLRADRWVKRAWGLQPVEAGRRWGKLSGRADKTQHHLTIQYGPAVWALPAQHRAGLAKAKRERQGPCFGEAQCREACLASLSDLRRLGSRAPWLGPVWCVFPARAWVCRCPSLLDSGV